MSLENILRNIKWFIQRVFRGYSDYDLTGYDQFACKKILPSLKAWVAHERCGYPESAGTFENWNKILEEIVWAVEETATSKNELALYTDESLKNMTDEDRYKAIKDIWERQERGLKLFGEYLGAMWD